MKAALDRKELRKSEMHKFTEVIEIIGINPFVPVPVDVLQEIFEQAMKDKGMIPVRGILNGVPYKQTLVKYSGDWRLYINAKMLKNSPKRIGEKVDIELEYDPESREIQMPDSFREALRENQEADAVFNNLSSSRKREIVRYLANLKSDDSLQRNIQRALGFLLGNERFVGRDRP